MTSTDQAFITAYERASDEASPHTTIRTGESPAARGPHFSPKKTKRAPLSELIAARSETLPQAEDSSPAREDIPSLVPAIEMNHFHWPTAVRELAYTCADTMRSLTEQLLTSGTNVLALTSPRRGVGLTTTTLALARVALLSGGRVAMVDLAPGGTGVAEMFGFHRVRTLNEAALRGDTLGEAIVHGRSEHASFVVVEPGLDSRIAAAALTRLAEAHDWVFIDAGVAGDPDRPLDDWTLPMGGATLLVDQTSERGTDDAPRTAALRTLSNAGSRFLGVIENLA